MIMCYANKKHCAGGCSARMCRGGVPVWVARDQTERQLLYRPRLHRVGSSGPIAGVRVLE